MDAAKHRRDGLYKNYKLRKRRASRRAKDARSAPKDRRKSEKETRYIFNAFKYFPRVFNEPSSILRRLEVAGEEADVQNQQVSAKSAAAQSRRGTKQGV